MAGKPYTLSEMKSIVDYLVEHKAYGETKGKKMWMTFENSSITNRTWQSLKETFLKRIYPDIANPYYKLSREQIHSFKQGTDMEAKSINKLNVQTEIQLLSDNSSPNDNISKNCGIPSTDKTNAEETPSGESIKGKRDRCSVDTVILGNCYETADDVRRVLESPVSDELETPACSSSSFKNMITFSEPLTPMLQEVLHDFDSGDSEPCMQIVENEPITDERSDKSPRRSSNGNPIPAVDPISEQDDTEGKSANINSLNTPKIKSLRLKKKQADNKAVENWGVVGNTIDNLEPITTEKEVTNDSTAVDHPKQASSTLESVTKEKMENVTKTSAEPTQNCSNSTADTVLPNNQEALDSLLQKHKNTSINFNGISENSKHITLSQGLSSISATKNKSNTAVNPRHKQVSMSDTEIKKIEKIPGFLKAFKSKNNVATNKITESKNDIADLLTIERENKKKNPNNDDHRDCSVQTSQVNPCLQSVSLYDEHFILDNYIETSDTEEKPKKGGKKQNSSVKNNDSNENPNYSRKVANDNNKNTTTTDVNKNHIDDETKIDKSRLEDVVLLNSHSDSDSDQPGQSAREVVPKLKRNKALDKLFGYSSGAVLTKQSTNRSVPNSHQYQRYSSSVESSESTSESDSEYNSPRRNRTRRHSDKPKSHRVHCLEEEGGLFVKIGKKIYPVTKKGTTMIRYLTHNSESDPDEDVNYWKEKYEKEKKKVADLKRNRSAPRIIEISPEASPKMIGEVIDENQPELVVEQPKTNPPTSAVSGNDKPLKFKYAANTREVQIEGPWTQMHPFVAQVVGMIQNDITSDHPALQQQRVADQPEEYANPSYSGHRQSQEQSTFREALRMSLPLPPPPVVDLHRETKPVDPVVREKTTQLESKIFKEIEEREQEESGEEENNEDIVVSNVTKRKRQARSNIATPAKYLETSSPIANRNPKRMKHSLTTENIEIASWLEAVASGSTDLTSKSSQTPKKGIRTPKLKLLTPENLERVSRLEAVASGSTDRTSKLSQTSKKGIRTPKKKSFTAENIEIASRLEAVANGSAVRTSKSSQTPKKRTRTPQKRPGWNDTSPEPKVETKTMKSTESLFEPAKKEDDDVSLYMHPVNMNGYITRTRTTRRHLISKQPKIPPSPNISQNSESNQGYVDSDVSPVKLLPKRRRRLSLSIASKKSKAYDRAKRHSCPTLIGELSNDSNTSFHIIIKHHSNERSLQSSLYRSDSYQLLVPQKKKSFSVLDKITEECSVIKQTETDKRNRAQSSISECSEDIIETSKNKIHNDIVSLGHSSYGNSSSVSLPPSPELSIVENLSVSKELINGFKKNSSINENRENETDTNITDDKYLPSNIDVSMSLMQDGCGTKTKCLEGPQNITMHESKKCGVTESLLNNIETVNIAGGTSLSESLHHRIQNLLLDSAKKMSVLSVYKNENTKVKSVTKKAGNSKRCSTPHKKNQKKKGIPVNIDPVVEEEYMETCSFGGRKSCPPSIEIINTANINQLLAPENESRDVPKEKQRTTRGRVKKDIIKVKILRPKVKGKQKVNDPKPSKNQSACADSGINITKSATSSNSNSSIDLIHNHSETCLQVNECLEDSVELIEGTESIISINSDSSAIEAQDTFEDCKDILTEILSNNAKDFADALPNPEPSILKIESPTETQYHSPIASETSINSLITEDLSDDIMQTCPPSPPSLDWFLLSDEDNTNTNRASQTPKSNCSSFGANLQQIFPITCAIPDLSTITEMSKDNGDSNSRKPFSDISACDSNTNEF